MNRNPLFLVGSCENGAYTMVNPSVAGRIGVPRWIFGQGQHLRVHLENLSWVPWWVYWVTWWNFKANWDRCPNICSPAWLASWFPGDFECIPGLFVPEQLSGCTDPRRPITSTFPAHILHLPQCGCQSTSLHANSQDSVSQLNYEHLFAHWRIGKWLSSASASSCSSRLAGTARTAR